MTTQISTNRRPAARLDSGTNPNIELRRLSRGPARSHRARHDVSRKAARQRQRNYDAGKRPVSPPEPKRGWSWLLGKVGIKYGGL